MSAIAIHHTKTQEGAWDGPGNVARLRSGESSAYYARCYAWRDPDGDPETKAAYKFPHHFVGADGNPGAASIRGCQSGIAVLNGSMGGADIPENDRRGVYSHLAAHLRDGDVEPAELASQRGEMERRFVECEVRVKDDLDGAPHIEGYGAVFNEWSEDLGGFREMVEPGAFTNTLQGADVRSLWNHDPLYVLGRNISGTLRLFVNSHGLGYDVVPPDAQWARDLLVSIRRGDVNASSFGFSVLRDKWEQDTDGKVTRKLVEVELFDLGPVTFPAYPQTSTEARARAEGLIATLECGDSEAEEARARARLDILRRRLDLDELEIAGR